MSSPSWRRRAGLPDDRLTVGQRVFGLTVWTRNGTLAEYDACHAARPEIAGVAAHGVVTPLGSGHERLRDARATASVAAVLPLADRSAAFGADAARVPGKTIIQVAEGR